ncbi:MAG: hypothetical protein MZV70_72920 [Desulfobacterales bacterium]|nr:hypothetical protein [Desulfobacterales bacterium]
MGRITWSVTDGPHFSPNYVDENNGVPFISSRNVSYDGIDLAMLNILVQKITPSSQKGLVQIGDVLLTKGGTAGIAAVVRTDKVQHLGSCSPNELSMNY